jgi:hypothetical protein
MTAKRIITERARREPRYQPPPLVKKRRMKRSCSEWELFVLILSIATSEDEGETLEHLQNSTDCSGGSSTKIALRIQARSADDGTFAW